MIASADLFERRAGTAVEYEVDRIFTRAVFFLYVFLGVAQYRRFEHHVTRFVHAVNVSERSGDSEVGAYLEKFFVCVCHVFRLGVQLAGMYIRMVHTVFLASGYTEFYFERHAHFTHALQITLAYFDVVLERFGGKVYHVRGEKRLACLGKVFLAGGKKSVYPGKEFFAQWSVCSITGTPYISARVCTCLAPAIAPAMDAC